MANAIPASSHSRSRRASSAARRAFPSHRLASHQRASTTGTSTDQAEEVLSLGGPEPHRGIRQRDQQQTTASHSGQGSGPPPRYMVGRDPGAMAPVANRSSREETRPAGTTSVGQRAARSTRGARGARAAPLSTRRSRRALAQIAQASTTDCSPHPDVARTRVQNNFKCCYVTRTRGNVRRKSAGNRQARDTCQ